jgi:hypothetical protein
VVLRTLPRLQHGHITADKKEIRDFPKSLRNFLYPQNSIRNSKNIFIRRKGMIGFQKGENLQKEGIL